MLRTLADRLYSKSSAIKWFKRKYSDEEIFFASAATILETKKNAPIGWSFQRIFQHRGVVIITRNQLVLKDGLFSFSFILYLSLLIFALYTLFESQDWSYLFAVIVFSVPVVQFRPYQQYIPFKDIQKAKLGSVSGIFTKGSLLTVYLKDKTVNIVPAQILSEEIKHIISSSKN